MLSQLTYLATNLVVRFCKLSLGESTPKKNIHSLIKSEFDERKSFIKKRIAVKFIYWVIFTLIERTSLKSVQQHRKTFTIYKMQHHFFWSCICHFSKYRICRTIKRSFSIIQGAFKFTWADNKYSEVPHLSYPWQTHSILLSNVSTCDIKTVTDTYTTWFFYIDTHYYLLCLCAT